MLAELCKLTSSAILCCMIKREIGFNAELLPAKIRPYLSGAKLYDSSCSQTAVTMYIEGESKLFLKIDGRGKLYRESEMLRFMGRWGLCPQVLEYFSEQGCDYLLCTAIEGEDCIHSEYKQHPMRLAKVLGESLRVLHSLPTEGCPFPMRSMEMLEESRANIHRGFYDKELIPEQLGVAAHRLRQLQDALQDEVLIHGDYCLPNIILRDFKLAGFVDLGTGGIGDRHYDLFWGLWSLNYNLKTDAYRDAFLDAYGRQDVEPQKLELCRLVAGFTE